MYWIGRYLERTENTARLINVNANLLLDLPRMVKHIWRGLIDISGSNDLFYTKYDKADEKNVTRFMLADEANHASIVCSIRMLRENARTTREIIPTEAWEQINEFHLFAKQHVKNALKRNAQYEFLDSVITFCHQITGLLLGNMSHGNAYTFTRIGSNLERADMTTRIVDVGCMDLLRRRFDIPETYDNILWMNVLRSLSAYQMYRQHVLGRVSGEDVVAFLMKNQEFPRSVAHCMSELNLNVSRLPGNDHALRSITHVQRVIRDVDVHKLFAGTLHEFIDELQVDLGEIHNQVVQSWFGYITQVQDQHQE